MNAASVDILLVALNARYIHAAFGLRYLMANLGALQSRAALLERTIHDDPHDVVERILATRPRIVGLGVYIWNVDLVRRVVATLRAVSPSTLLIVGGPEVSHEVDAQPWLADVDVVVTGEGDHVFRELCAAYLADPVPPQTRPRIVSAPPVAPATLALPYALYDADDIANRVLYVEASRGCPFRCEFCLSSLDASVRAFDLDRFLGAMEDLWARGARHFKFVDRTFNLKPATTNRILDFFLARVEPGMFLHFEMIPDHLPASVRERIVRFPPGTVQFEVGIQTFDTDTAARISRRQDLTRLEANLAFLRDHTAVHVHADLIMGLPGEGLESLAAGFDRLFGMGPAEIQLGVLKRLRGTPIVRHDAAYGMVYDRTAPYEVLQTSTLEFTTLQRLKRVASFWDKLGNSGNYRATLALWLGQVPSPFYALLELSDLLHARFGRTHSLAAHKLAEALFEALTTDFGLERDAVAAALVSDWKRVARKGLPGFLEPWQHVARHSEGMRPQGTPRRQSRHAAP